MKLSFSKTAIAGLLFSVSSIASAGVIPYGIQANLSQSTIEGWGWSECSRSAANSYGTVTTQSVVDSCTGDYLMMAAWDASENTYAIAAAGDTATVTTDTFTNHLDDSNYNVLDNWSNGVNFYKTEDSGYGSWGFTNMYSVALSSADLNLIDGFNNYGSSGTSFTEEDAGYQAIGLSFHTNNDGTFGSGWGYNATGNDWTGIFNTGDQRVFFSYSAAVPEPSTLAIFMLGLMGLAIRRSRARGDTMKLPQFNGQF